MVLLPLIKILNMFDFNLFLKDVPNKPGIYQMIDSQGSVLYVGKAKDLKNRLTNYKNVIDNERIHNMVKKIDHIILTITQTENEALLIENNLIKHHQPPYNILLKDDKSYPYIALTKGAYPELKWYRGQPHSDLILFGPYPSVETAKLTIELILKIFQLRTCSDHTFKTRHRPCLQYQINQCSAPCVQYVTQSQYAEQIDQVIAFLKNSSVDLLDELEKMMLNFSAQFEYEKAGQMRDHIRRLRLMQRHQQVEVSDVQKRVDILAVELPYLHHLMILDGKVQRSEFIPIIDKLGLNFSESIEEILNRLYDGLPSYWIPAIVIVASLEAKIMVHGQVVVIRKANNEVEKSWLKIATDSLIQNMATYSEKNDFFLKRFKDLSTSLELNSIKSIDCIDVSHHQGDQTVAAIIRCTDKGFVKKDYRKYIIQHDGVFLNNDALSINQTITRHILKRIEENNLPDLLLVDGGLIQLKATILALDEFNLNIHILAIAKGPQRKSGLEKIFKWDKDTEEGLQIEFKQNQPGFHLLQQARDEAHRYVLAFQKKRQEKKSLSHPLDDLKGIGEEKKQKLLRTFGGWQGLIKAEYNELIKIESIGPQLANKILNFLEKYK